MEQKRIKMQTACKRMYQTTRVFYILTFLLILFLGYSIVMGMIAPKEAIIVEQTNDGWLVRSDEYFLGFTITTPFHILQSSADIMYQGKQLLILSNLVVLFFAIIPSAVMINLGKDTFYNIAFGEKPFSQESVANLKKIAILQLLLSVLLNIVWSFLMNIILLKQFHISFHISLGGVFIAALIYTIAYVFDYACDLQQKWEETLEARE